MDSIPLSRAALLRVLAAGLPPPGDFPLRDRQPESGLFGPSSATWEVMRQPLLILGAARALLMQSAHPLVAQGALDHSDFAKDPIGRFQRTAGWVTTVVFGTTDEAKAATRAVNRVHRKVLGDLPPDNATAVWGPGSAYRAQDQDLLLWVHASLIDAMLTTHRAVIGAINQGQGDRFVREWDAVAKLMGLPPGSTWDSEAQMRVWIERQLRHGLALPGPGSRLVASVILAPGPGGPALAKVTSLITAGMLPSRVRSRFGIPWNAAHEVAYRALTLSLRAARPALPRQLRVAPTYEFAMARATGELLRGSARTERLLARLNAA
ncbi:MAG TPA: oxygenase MpaB family protein [Candidatus Dormibacteraeota bacterium]|nr:oxygenase MpaB family protein [Candidatus Dormibacteraeota bacterium]